MRKALVFNSNAGGVNLKKIAKLMPLQSDDFDIFISTTEDEGAEIMQQACQNYDLIITGGGDDTVRSALTGMQGLNGHPKPLIATVKLGTGDGVSHALGARNAYEDITMLKERSLDSLSIKNIPIIRVEAQGVRHKIGPIDFPFAGTGFSAHMLRNYEDGTFTGLPGYLSAIPKTMIELVGDYPYASISSKSLEGLVDDGDGLRLIPPVLPDTKINSVTCGTTPYFGFRFKAIRYAGEAANLGRMYVGLCLGKALPAAIKTTLHALPRWGVNPRNQELFASYMADDLTETYHDAPGSLQVAGRSYGKVHQVTYKVIAPQPMVEFNLSREEDHPKLLT